MTLEIKKFPFQIQAIRLIARLVIWVPDSNIAKLYPNYNIQQGGDYHPIELLIFFAPFV